MSHAPGNPDRHWDAGMRDNDVVILIKAYDVDGDIRISNHINAFSISMLRSSQDNSRIGPPKSNSEGAERTITWPAWIPSSDGVVDEIQREADGNTRKIKVHYDDGRFYTYSRMDNKHVYLEEGERFKGNEQIILGLPQSLVSLDGTNPSWSPSNDLSSSNLSDQLASVKSFTRLDPMPVIEQLKQIFLDAQTDPRIRLETAGVLARHNIPEGLDFLSDQALNNHVLDPAQQPPHMFKQIHQPYTSKTNILTYIYTYYMYVYIYTYVYVYHTCTHVVYMYPFAHCRLPYCESAYLHASTCIHIAMGSRQ